MKLNFFYNKNQTKRMNLIKKLTYNQGYSILKSSRTLMDDDFSLQLAIESDEYGYMSEELGRELDKLFEDSDYIVGLHRTGYTHMSDSIINSIFTKGLKNNGHIMQGTVSGSTNINNTVSFFPFLSVFCSQLKVAWKYYDSEGSIIVKIPKSYLGKGEGEIKPIFYKDDKEIKLLPEFVYGFVSVNKEGKLGEIKRNPNYKNVHNINNVNLIYDDGAESRAKEKGVDLTKNDISLDEKYKIIEKAYQDTLVKYGKYQAEQALLNLINNSDVSYFTGQENRLLLSKYVIYGDILCILALSNKNLINNDENVIINSFTQNSSKILEENSRLK